MQILTNKSKLSFSIKDMSVDEFETLQLILKTIRIDIVESPKEVEFDGQKWFLNGSYAYRVDAHTKELIDNLTSKLCL